MFCRSCVLPGTPVQRRSATPLWHRAQARLAIHALLLGRLTRGDMLQGHVAGTNPIVWTLDFHEKSCCGDEILSPRHAPWIQISLNWGTCRGDKTTFERKVASCELFMRHVPAENKPIRKRNHDKSLRQDPPCEHFKKPIPATCPFVWTAHEILPRDMSLQHVPSCEPTFTAIYGHKGFVWEDRWAVND